MPGFNNTNVYSCLTVVDPNGASGDIDINLAQNYGTLPAGQSRSVVWYMVFGNSEMEVTNVFATFGSNAPIITSQPVSVTVPTGNDATFTVGTIGTAPLSYFWQRNGAFIAGGTNSTYTTNNVQLADSGRPLQLRGQQCLRNDQQPGGDAYRFGTAAHDYPATCKLDGACRWHGQL